MSSPIWTPDALSRETHARSGSCWRLVEAQHHVSTLKLVDTLEEQEILESLIEDTKPRLPEECRHLHYLLSTPFRYPALYPTGSRFRPAGLTPGVFYASERADTAVAELVFRRLLFFSESPDTPWPSNPGEYTAFAAVYATSKAIDLTASPFRESRSAWAHTHDYSACHDLVGRARAVAIELIRYESVRHADGLNVAVLACGVFTEPEPTAFRTWRIHLGSSGAQAICETPRQRLSFDRSAFAADPRIAALRWER